MKILFEDNNSIIRKNKNVLCLDNGNNIPEEQLIVNNKQVV